MEILRNNSEAVVDSEKFLITDIKPAVKNQNRVNVFVDGKYSFSLDVAQVVDLKIKVNRRLSEEELKELRNESEFGKLYQTALNWILVRPRSVKETADYLEKKKMTRQMENRKRELNAIRIKENPELRKMRNYRDADGFCYEKDQKIATKKLPEYEKGMLERVLKKLVEKGYVDDRKFAEYYVENRFMKKGISQRRMRMELTKKGISKEIIEEVLHDGGRGDEEEIKKIIAKKRSKYDDEKLVSYLVRQGFDYQLVQNLVHCETD